MKRRIQKIKKKITKKSKMLKEFLSGNYTTANIPLSWEGKPERFDLINAIAKETGAKTYLEIGCRSDDCFTQVHIPHRVGVDPASGGTHRMTSDEFFAQNKETFDIIFIDGLHTYEQVIVDIKNSLACLNEGGTILMHDCLPNKCLAQYDYPVIGQWNGDTWKAFLEARTMRDVDAAICLIDHGVGVLKKRKNANPVNVETNNFKTLKYRMLANDYQRLMHTLDYDDALKFALAA